MTTEPHRQSIDPEPTGPTSARPTDPAGADLAAAFDSVSGFPRWPYLLARLQEFYRQCAALRLDPAAHGRLFLMDLGRPSCAVPEMATLGLRMESAYWLRHTFTDGESLVTLADTVNAVFAMSRPGLEQDLHEVRAAVTDLWHGLHGEVTGLALPVVTPVRLPGKLAAVAPFVRSLAHAAVSHQPLIDLDQKRQLESN